MMSRVAAMLGSRRCACYKGLESVSTQLRKYITIVIAGLIERAACQAKLRIRNKMFVGYLSFSKRVFLGFDPAEEVSDAFNIFFVSAKE